MEEKKAAPPKLSRDEGITRLVRAYIGPRWEKHYAKAWRNLGSGAGVNIGVSWNWAAALLTVPWLAYRKQMTSAIGVIVVLVVIHAFLGDRVTELTGSPYPIYMVWLIVGVLFGCYGDVMILQRAYAVASMAHNDAGATQAVAFGVINAGGVSPVRVIGVFTLPLLIGAAAWFLIVIPYRAAPLRQEEEAMRLYLDHLLSMEVQYREDSARYVSDTTAFRAIADSVDRVFTPTIVATDSTFQATVVSQPPLDVRCAIAIRAPNPISGDTTSGVVCRNDRAPGVTGAPQTP